MSGADFAAPLFAALGDPTRLTLVSRLADGQSRSIAGLSADTGMTRQAVTKHLKMLSAAGLVAARKVGRESLYDLRPDTVVAAQDYLATVSRQWDEALLRLQRLVED